MNKDYTPAYLTICASVGHLFFIADTHVKSAELLEKANNRSEYLQSFHTLVSISFELLPKVLLACKVCLRHQNDINLTTDELNQIIEEELRKSGHDIKTLFESIQGLNEETGIEEIVKIPESKTQESFVCEYRIKVCGYDYPIGIKDIEAVRYGSFSNIKDVMIDSTNNMQILALLSKLRDVVSEKKNAMIQEIRKEM